jgi:hypothetical protein
MALFDYTLLVTGDCQNNGSGAFQISFSGGIEPYTVQFVDPYYPTVTLAENAPVTKSGLFSSVVLMTVNDSTLPTNQEINVNIPISSGVCCSVLGVQNTTCAENNGSVTGSSNTIYSSANYSVFSGDGTLVQTFLSSNPTVIFENLSAGTYYLAVSDLGGC